MRPSRMVAMRNSPTFQTNLIAMAVLLAGLAILRLTPNAPAQEAPEPKRILVLYWDNRESQADDTFARNFQKTLESVPPGTFEYYSEYLESSRFPGENQSLLVRDYLQQKYSDRKIDVVVASAPVPLSFLLRYRNDLFTRTPIVFVSARRPTSTELAAGPGMTGLVMLNAYRETLDLALSLHPRTEHVFIVSGSLDRDKEYEKLCREELHDYESPASIDYLTDLKPDELDSRMRNLPARSIVLYIWQQSRNEDGKILQTSDVLASIASAADVPLYGMANWQIGKGIVGGYVRTVEVNGIRTAEIAMRVANGERPQDIPLEGIPVVPMFDSRELERWGIEEALLPLGSIIRFRVPSFWTEYRWYAIGGISILILQSMLIAGLVINRSLRKRAEVERERFASLAEAERLRLDEVVSHVPGVVWESVQEHGEAAREAMLVSDYAAKMLGYSVEEWLSTPGFAQSIIHPKDRDYVARVSEAILKDGGEGVLQFRWMAKDGRQLWAEAHLAATRDQTGKIIGLRGITIDITERKWATEALYQMQESLTIALEASQMGTWDLDLIKDYSGHRSLRHDQIFGYDAPQADWGREVARRHIVEEDRPIFDAAFARAMLTGDLDFEARVRWPDGSIHWMAARGRFYLDDNGQPTRGAGVNFDITERKRAEESLHISEERNRAILRAIPDLMFINSAEGVYLDHQANDPGDLLVPPTEFLGKNIREVLPVELADLFLSSFRRAQETDEPQSVEYMLPLNGDERWFEARVVTTQGDKILTVVRDITARKLAEAAVKENEARLGGIVGSAMDGIISFDQSQRIVLFNAAAETIFGCDAQEALGESVERFVPERFREAHRELIRTFGDPNVTTRALGSPVPIYGRRVDGEEFPMEASISQLELHGQKFYTVILRDITKRQRAVEALRESEERFRNMADTAPVMIWVSGADKTCTYFNQQRLDFTGRTMKQEIRAGWAEGVHPEDLERCLDHYNNAFDRRAQFTMEYRLRRADGQYRWVLDTGRARFSSGGTFLGFISSCIDITERKAAEEGLASLSGQLIRAREDECSRIARELHDDVSQSIALVSIDLQQLRQTPPETTDALRERLEIALTQITETSKKIHRVSRDLHPSKLVHLGLVQTLESLFVELRQRHGLKIKFVSGRLPSDMSQDISLCLYRIVQECLNNIIKHSGAKRCEVDLLRSRGEIRLRVSDSGMGFDIESPSTKKGLGLISMRERLRLVGGSISIDSRPSLGTQIDARVPLGRETSQDEGPSQEDNTRAGRG